MSWVIVLFWESRWSPSQPTKSLAGHSALQTARSYASWSPEEGRALASITGAVWPSPRGAYETDTGRSGGSGPPLHSKQVRLEGLDVASIDAAWRGKAAHLADPAFHGPPIAYSLIPGAERTSASSCATLTLQLLLAGGAAAIEPCRASAIVTPRAVYEYAQRLKAKLEAIAAAEAE